MNIKLAEISQEIWQSIKDNQKLIFPSTNDSWLFKICGLYNKDKVTLFLCSIPTPGTPYSKLQPLTTSDEASAFAQANLILDELLRRRP